MVTENELLSNEAQVLSDSDDFLWKSLAVGEETDPVEPHHRPPKSSYNSKKPKWWRQQSRRPSAKLKRAIHDMRNFWMNQPVYGEFIDWKETFSKTEELPEVWIEIGFGLGDNLLCLAERHPGRCFVGSEVHVSGIGTILHRMQTAMQDQRYWQGFKLIDGMCSPPTVVINPNPYQNLRIYKRDVTKLLPSIPDKSIHTLLVTFPDPFFPSGEEWRLLQSDVLVDFHRVLQVGGHIYLATDHEKYYSWVKEQVEKANMNQEHQLFATLDPVPDRSTWLPVVSKYEQKANREGRTTTFLACWVSI